MSKLFLLLFATAPAAGAFFAVHFTAAEKKLAAFIFENDYELMGFIYIIRKDTRVIPAVIAYAVWLLSSIVLVLGARFIRRRRMVQTRKEKVAPTQAANPFYRHLNELIKDFNRNKSIRNESPGREELFFQRSRMLTFLTNLNGLISPEMESLPTGSGLEPADLPPDLETIRTRLQQALYIDMPAFDRQADPDQLSAAGMDWRVASDLLNAIEKAAVSLKAAFQIYVDACRADREAFAPFEDQGVLPLAVGTPPPMETAHLRNEKKLGEGFDYAALDQFRERMAPSGTPLNPSMGECLSWLEDGVVRLIKPLDRLLSRGKSLFPLLELAHTAACRQLEWVNRKLKSNELAAESAAYYSEVFAKCKTTYLERLDQSGLPERELPPGLLGRTDLERLQGILDNMARESAHRQTARRGSQIVYQTGVHRKDPEEGI